MTPSFKVVKIFLENLWFRRCWDGKIKSSVICKESHFGFDIHRNDIIKGIAEVKQNEISLLFLIDGFEKIIDQHEELGFTRALLSEAMLELIEDI